MVPGKRAGIGVIEISRFPHLFSESGAAMATLGGAMTD